MSYSERPDWDEYFLTIADAVATRADCRRKRVGAVLVDSKRRIISTGYNGAPPGEPGCLAGHCPRGRLTCEHVPPEMGGMEDVGTPGYCIAVHAELNCLLFATRDTTGGTLYVTHQPCNACAKAIRAAGIDRVIWRPHNE